jgi:hypothetical protein
MRLGSILLLAGLFAAGCGPRTTRVDRSSVDPDTGQTVRVERDVDDPGRTVPADEPDAHACSGVLSCSADAEGSAIALPFRVIGGAVRAIF